MRIQNNVPALNAHRYYTLNNQGMTKSIAKLSSGYRINSAADDAAGLAISEKMRAQIRGLNMASKNAQDAISLIQTAEGGLQEIGDMVQKIRELVNYASSDTQEHNAFGTGDRQKIQDEINQLTQEIDKMAGRVEFNKKTLLDGSLAGVPENAATLMANVASARDILKLQQQDYAKALKDFNDASVGAQNARDAFNSIYTDPNIDKFLQNISLNGGDTVADEVNDVMAALADLRKTMSVTTTKQGLDTAAQAKVLAVQDKMSLLNTALGQVSKTNVETIDDARAAFDNLSNILGGGTASAPTPDDLLAEVTRLASEMEALLKYDTGIGAAPHTTLGQLLADLDAIGETVADAGDGPLSATTAAIKSEIDAILAAIGNISASDEIEGATNARETIQTALDAIKSAMASMADIPPGGISDADKAKIDELVALFGSGDVEYTKGDGTVVKTEQGSIADALVGADGTGGLLTAYKDALYALENPTPATPPGGGGSGTFSATLVSGSGSAATTTTGPTSKVNTDLTGVTFTPTLAAIGSNGTNVNTYSFGSNAGGASMPSGVTVTFDGAASTGAVAAGELAIGTALVFNIADANSGATYKLTVTATAAWGDAAAVNAAVKAALEGFKATVTETPVTPPPTPGTPTPTPPVGPVDTNNSIGKAFETLKSNYQNYEDERVELADENGKLNDARTDLALAQAELNAAPKTGGLYFQVGANSNQGQQLYINSVKTDWLGIGDGNGVSMINVLDSTGANTTAQLDTIDMALSYVTTERSKLGAAQNRLTHTINSLDVSAENLQAAEARIRDVDMAKEMSNFTRQNILFQASTAMLAQANAMPQGVLQLLG